MVDIFPNDDAIVRLLGMALTEQHAEWQVGRRYSIAESGEAVEGRAVAVAAT